MDRRERAGNYAGLGHILKKIYAAEVALEPGHHSKRKALEFFLNSFKEFSLRESPEFQRIFQDFYCTGSYFEGLRVSKATEFDVNVVFSLLLDGLEYEINELDRPLSYATYQLKHFSNLHLQSEKLISLFDEEEYLVGENIRRWFQSLVASFIQYSDLNYPGVFQVKVTHSGPARTLKVFYDFVWISIDLVPVILIDVKQIHKCEMEHVNVSEDTFSNCVLVPKPLKLELSDQMTPELAKRVWRIHFPETEKQIIKGKNSLKPVLKLMKDLRDKQGWPIPSYFIKVVAFWLVKKHPDLHYWNHSRLGFLFLNFLESMEEHLSERYLGHILYPNFNLFHSLRERTLQDLQRRIQKIISLLKRRPRVAYELFKVQGLVSQL